MGRKKNIYGQGWPVSPVYLCCSICSVLKRIEKEKKITGQGWPVSPGARIGPDSGPIFRAHI